MGQWPSPVVASIADGELYIASFVLWIDITSPTEAQVVGNASVSVSWAMAPGTQQTARVLVYSDAGLTALVYDSGTLVTPVKSHTIPEGSLDSSATYYLRVTATMTSGESAASDTRTFSTSFAPVNALVGLRLTILGDQVTGRRQGAVELPGVRISWSQASLNIAEQFLRYSVWRRSVTYPASAWQRIASVTALTTLSYTDNTTPLFQQVEYDVTFSAHNTTTNNDLTSSRHTVTAAMRALIRNDFTYLHDISDPRNFVQYHQFTGDLKPTGEMQQVQFWGATKPVVYVGNINYLRFTLPGLPDERRGDIGPLIEVLRERQRDAGAVVCLRIGQHAVRAFCAITNSHYRLNRGAYEPEIELVEVEHTEAVT